MEKNNNPAELRRIGFITIAAIIALSTTVCSNPTNSSPAPIRTVSISPSPFAAVHTELAAVYGGADDVSYQWKKDGEDIDDATGEKYTPIAVGAYTVTVSTAGNKSITSEPVMAEGPGSGTVGDPTRVYTGADLLKVNTDNTTRGAHYLQRNDITLNGEWMPIGTIINNFTGTYDGGGNTINGLTITANTSDQGLFGYIHTDSVVRNIRLSGANVSGHSYIGGVVGTNYGMVQGCTVINSTISGEGNTGGVVGTNFGIVQGCTVTNSTVSGVTRAGGVAGTNAEGMVQGCTVTNSTVSSQNIAGGVAGQNNDMIQKCYVSAAVIVIGNGIAGGVAGFNYTPASRVLNCYAAGSVESPGNAGGVVGDNGDANSLVQYCYAVNSVKSSNAGGICGSPNGSVINCVALNTGITGTDPNTARVIYNGTDIKDFNNYANKDMLVNNKKVTSTDKTGRHGADITETQWNSAAWWTDADNWTTAAWDTTIWNISGKLPTLR